jgi:hypothetical protein
MKRVGLGLIGTVVVFLVLHSLGYRDDAGFLSGSRVSSPLGGVVYVLSYFATVVAVPVVMMGVAIFWLWERRPPRERRGQRLEPGRPHGVRAQRNPTKSFRFDGG